MVSKLRYGDVVTGPVAVPQCLLELAVNGIALEGIAQAAAGGIIADVGRRIHESVGAHLPALRECVLDGTPGRTRDIRDAILFPHAARVPRSAHTLGPREEEVASVGCHRDAVVVPVDLDVRCGAGGSKGDRMVVGGAEVGCDSRSCDGAVNLAVSLDAEDLAGLLDEDGQLGYGRVPGPWPRTDLNLEV